MKRPAFQQIKDTAETGKLKGKERPNWSNLQQLRPSFTEAAERRLDWRHTGIPSEICFVSVFTPVSLLSRVGRWSGSSVRLGKVDLVSMIGTSLDKVSE